MKMDISRWIQANMSHRAGAGRWAVAVFMGIFTAAHVWAAPNGNWQTLPNRDASWPGSAFLDGDVYTITNGAHLAQFAYTVYNNGTTYLGKTVVLANDIDLSDHYWQFAGTDFRGVFDGKGHKIIGLTISATPSGGNIYDGGLFGRLDTNAEVRNVILEELDIQVTANGTGAVHVGGIAGRFAVSPTNPDAATIENCRVGGKIVVGKSTVTGTVYAGGIVGFLGASGGSGRIIRDCVNNAAISVNASSNVYLGGITGFINQPSKAYNLLNTGVIQRTGNGSAASVGGLAGGLTIAANGTDLYVANGFNTGNVTATGSGSLSVGALIGYPSSVNIATSTANLYWLTGTAANGFGVNAASAPASILPVNAGLPATLASAHPFYLTDDLLAVLNGWVGAQNTWGSTWRSWGVVPGVNNDRPVLLDELVYTSWADEVNRDTDWPNNGNYDGVDNYTIRNERELAQFAWTVAQGNNYYGQTVELLPGIYDLSAYNWMPAGTVFRGTFDGGNNVVCRMRVVMDGVAGDASAGFFDALGQDGTVKNLQLVNATVAVLQKSGAHLYVGGVTGRMGVNSLIDGCYVSGRVYGKALGGDVRIGGIVGENGASGSSQAGIIRNCANAAAVTGEADSADVGGIAGYISYHAKGRIYNCLNMGPIHAEAPVGYYNSVTVGGIAGAMYGTGSSEQQNYFANCFNTGDISSVGGYVGYSVYVGSLFGYVMYGDQNHPFVANSYWLDGTTGAASFSAMPNTILKVIAPAPGVFDNSGQNYGANNPEDALNAWVNNDPAYLGWTVKPGVNMGYPVPDMAYPGSLVVTLDPNGGSGDVQTVLVNQGGFLPAAQAPTRYGYDFAGFFDEFDNEYYDSAMTGALWDKPTGDTLYAKWTAVSNILVQFDYKGATGGETNEFSRPVTFGQPYGKLPVPIKAGNAFTGWYLLGLPHDEITAATLVENAGPHELIAQWEAVPDVLVIFEYNNGNVLSGLFKSYHAPYGELPTPFMHGYTFDGWYHEYTTVKVDEWTLITNKNDHILEAWWTLLHDGVIVPNTSTPEDPDDYFVITDGTGESPNHPSKYEGEDLVDVHPGNEITLYPEEEDDGYPFIIPEVPEFPDDGNNDYVFDPEKPAVIVIGPGGETNAVIHVPSGVIEVDLDGDGEIDLIRIPDTSTNNPDDYFVLYPGEDPKVNYPSEYGEPEENLVDVGVGTIIDHEIELGDIDYTFVVPLVPGFPDDEYDYVFVPEIPAVIVIDPGTGETNAVIHVPGGVIVIVDPETGDPTLILIPDPNGGEDDYFVIDPTDPKVGYPSDYGEPVDNLVDVGVGTEIGYDPEGKDGYPFTVPEVPGYPDDVYDYVFVPEIPAVIVIDPATGETNAVIHVPGGVIVIVDPGTGDPTLILIPDPNGGEDDYFVIDPTDPKVGYPSDYGEPGDNLVDVGVGTEIGYDPEGKDGYPFEVPLVPGFPDDVYDYVFVPEIPAVIVIDPLTGETNAVIHVPGGVIVYPTDPGEDLNTGKIIVPGLDGKFGTDDDITITKGTYDPETGLVTNITGPVTGGDNTDITGELDPGNNGTGGWIITDNGLILIPPDNGALTINGDGTVTVPEGGEIWVFIPPLTPVLVPVGPEGAIVDPKVPEVIIPGEPPVVIPVPPVNIVITAITLDYDVMTPGYYVTIVAAGCHSDKVSYKIIGAADLADTFTDVAGAPVLTTANKIGDELIFLFPKPAEDTFFFRVSTETLPSP